MFEEATYCLNMSYFVRVGIRKELAFFKDSTGQNAAKIKHLRGWENLERHKFQVVKMREILYLHWVEAPQICPFPGERGELIWMNTQSHYAVVSSVYRNNRELKGDLTMQCFPEIKLRSAHCAGTVNIQQVWLMRDLDWTGKYKLRLADMTKLGWYDLQRRKNPEFTPLKGCYVPYTHWHLLLQYPAIPGAATSLSTSAFRDSWELCFHGRTRTSLLPWFTFSLSLVLYLSTSSCAPHHVYLPCVFLPHSDIPVLASSTSDILINASTDSIIRPAFHVIIRHVEYQLDLIPLMSAYSLITPRFRFRTSRNNYVQYNRSILSFTLDSTLTSLDYASPDNFQLQDLFWPIWNPRTIEQTKYSDTSSW